MKYLILGAGVAGLTFATYLKHVRKENSFLVLEAENEVGGLCRSCLVDNAPLDIGGGHFLDVRRPKVTEYLFRFMPESEWYKYNRDSRIKLKDKIINHPIEANIWQLPVEEQVEYLESIAKAGCNIGAKIPEKFVDWIYWKLGNKIAEDYMIPYNKKMFGENLNELGIYWLDKLPSVNFRETLLSCLDKKFYGKQPGHAQFYYPKKFGYGEVWRRMAESISENIECNKKVIAIDFDSNKITTEDGTNYKADKIITTIPWAEFHEIKGMPENLKSDIKNLKHTGVQIKYFADNIDTQAHWIYFSDPEISYHRILCRHSWNKNYRGYWTETRLERVTDELEDKKISFVNNYAYPLNTIDKPRIMKNLLTWCREKNIYGLGRWGEHSHYNSDLVAESAILLAEKI